MIGESLAVSDSTRRTAKFYGFYNLLEDNKLTTFVVSPLICYAKFIGEVKA